MTTATTKVIHDEQTPEGRLTGQVVYLCLDNFDESNQRWFTNRGELMADGQFGSRETPVEFDTYEAARSAAIELAQRLGCPVLQTAVIGGTREIIFDPSI